ncbi:MAG: hypothetical protein K2Z81_08440 [Cyanobacteria bacterium]|nr:hypothetical protein [Cyanobacteriota bacterium]
MDQEPQTRSRLVEGWNWRGPKVELLTLSILLLFCELVIIRWLSTEIRIFAYFKNLPLLAVFLGSGLGFVWSNQKHDWYKWSAFGLLVLAGLLTVAFKLGLSYLTFVGPDQFMLWGLHPDPSIVFSLQQSVKGLVIMVGVFLLTSSIFVGLGQRMGRLFSELKPLPAYSINVFGGLLGSLLFVVLSFMSTSPGIWIIIAGLLFFLIDKRPVSVTLVLFGITYSAWLAPFLTDQSFHGNSVKTIWSPYYRIDVVRQMAPAPYKNVQLGFNVYINYDSFQSIVDCTPDTLTRLPSQARLAMLEQHAEPFQLLTKPDPNVLVLGSGTGSDVAAAIRNGVVNIDAVEIDPCIVTLGKELHPEHPYSSPTVSIFVTDARNYLQNCQKKYDLIVFAGLDSHAAFSALSSLRMDNYLFTEESLKKASSLLAPNGIIYHNFVVPGEWLWERHARTLALATGTAPIGYHNYGAQVGGTLITGISPDDLPSSLKKKNLEEVNTDSNTDVSTDDWPFLFLPRREIPSLYVMPLLILLFVSAIPVSFQFARGAKEIRNWQMFFLGVAFMLLEVRAMADLSLLFGSTWIVNSVVISAIMVVILIANTLAPRVSERCTPILLSGVLLSLSLSTFVSASTLIQFGPFWGAAFGITMYLLPLVFASIVFALLFNRVEHTRTALAFNLVGGGVGIGLEYICMWSGVRALGWLGCLLYAVVLILQLFEKQVATENVDRSVRIEPG